MILHANTVNMLHEAIWDIMDDQRSQSKTIKHLKWTWKTQLHDGYMTI